MAKRQAAEPGKTRGKLSLFDQKEKIMPKRRRNTTSKQIDKAATELKKAIRFAKDPEKFVKNQTANKAGQMFKKWIKKLLG